VIVCIGEAVIDMFQKKASGLGDVFMPLPGGCCFNTSLAIGALGVPAAFTGRISKSFFGDIQVDRLRQYNVKDNLIIRCDENPVLAFIKTEEGKQPQYAFYVEGTSDRLLSIDEIPALPSDTECIVFGSISLNMEPIATTIEIFVSKETKRRVIAFDPNIRPFMIKDRNAYIERFKKWISLSAIIKISSEDLEYLFPGTEPQAALQKILDIDTAYSEVSRASYSEASRVSCSEAPRASCSEAPRAKLAIVTLGSYGAAALLRRADASVIKACAAGIHVPQIADTVGAGDTFHGALLSWLSLRGKLSHNAIANLSEEDLRNALCFANKAAAVVCTRFGAQPPSLEEIEEYN